MTVSTLSRQSLCIARDHRTIARPRPWLAAFFSENRYGKPALATESKLTSNGLHFNLSHSGDLALIGIADDLETGVDIELLRNFDDIEPLAEQNLTAQEHAELAATPCHDRTLVFLRGWTRKEACLKAVGCGLTVAPKTFHVGLSATPAAVVLEVGAGRVNVHVQSIDVGNDAVAAVAWLLS